MAEESWNDQMEETPNKNKSETQSIKIDGGISLAKVFIMSVSCIQILFYIMQVTFLFTTAPSLRGLWSTYGNFLSSAI